jgi:hypothetical protein
MKLNNDQEKYVSQLKEWLSERKKDLNYSLEQFDKLIIVLSSGGLVLTIGFVKDIVKITEETDTFLLKFCWFSLTAALVFILMSQISCFWANNIEISITNQEIREIEEVGEFNDKTNRIKIKRFFFKISNALISVLNVLSFLVLILGIILFIFFVNQNI